MPQSMSGGPRSSDLKIDESLFLGGEYVHLTATQLKNYGFTSAHNFGNDFKDIRQFSSTDNSKKVTQLIKVFFEMRLTECPTGSLNW